MTAFRILSSREARVIGAVLLMLLATELVCRIFETRLSADVRHLRSLTDVAARLAAAPENAERILVVGNSLAREGIDPELLASELQANRGRPAFVEGFFPDGSSVGEWSWGYRRFFGTSATAPDRVLIVTGRTHLLDSSAKPERLGAFHVARSDLGEALEPLDLEQDVRLLLARHSAMFASRDRLRPLVGYRLLPGYEQAMAWIGESERRRLRESTGAARQFDGALTNLQLLLGTLSSQGVEVSVLAVPLPGGYDLPEPVRRLLEERGTSLLDLSGMEGLTAGDYPDGYHLGERGRRLLTRRVARLMDGPDEAP